MARLDLEENNIPAAEAIYQNIISDIPQNNEAKLLLALIYNYYGSPDKGLLLGQQVLDSGYVPPTTNRFNWMGPLYDKQNNFAAAIKVYLLAIKVDPSDLQDEWALAQDYAKLGDKTQAIATAQALIAADPTDAQHFQDFINSLK